MNRAGRVREKLSEAQNHRCCYNGCDLRVSCTIEHLVNQSEGGGSNRENLVAACARCNELRSKIDSTIKFIAFLEGRKRKLRWANKLDAMRNRLRLLIDEFGMQNWLYVSTLILDNTSPKTGH